MNEINIICKINDEGKIEENYNNNLKNYNFPGVWALIGKDKRNCAENEKGMWTCLQVGETKDIQKEIQKDIKDFTRSAEIVDASYINYFGEKIFTYQKTWDSNIYLYIWIYENYKDLEFICIQENEDRDLRRKIEKLFALKTRAVGWRITGRALKEEKDSCGRSLFIQKEIEALETGDISVEIPDCILCKSSTTKYKKFEN